MPLPHCLSLLSCKEEGARITAVGALLDILLGVTKVTAGTLWHSAAMVADGLHSLSDAASDLVVVVARNLSRKTPTERFAYGFQRAETLGVLFIGILLALFAVGLAIDSVDTLLLGDTGQVPGTAAVVFAGVCVLVKEVYFQLSHTVGKRLQSQLLIANAHHSRTDVYTSLLVVAALLAARSGWYWLDPLMALCIAAMVMQVAFGFLRDALGELMEMNLPADEREALLERIRQVPGVRGCHGLRGRRVGLRYHLECRVEVAASCSVSEGHLIGDQVEAAIRELSDSVADVLVLVGPQSLEYSTVAPMPAVPPAAQVAEGGQVLYLDKVRAHTR